jgi:Uma2 family endonuclease
MTMTYPHVDEPIGRVLTGQEYDALPENALRELVDGVIRMMVTPTWRHQFVVRELAHRLDVLGRPKFRAGGPIEVRFADTHRRNPDVAVVTQEEYHKLESRVLPADVVLAVEVVSQGSQTDDRREKPFEYAEAGIPFYWRVELEPALAVHTFRLHFGGYASTGVFRPGDKLTVEGLEWAAIEVSDLDDD